MQTITKNDNQKKKKLYCRKELLYSYIVPKYIRVYWIFYIENDSTFLYLDRISIFFVKFAFIVWVVLYTKGYIWLACNITDTEVYYL